VDQLTPADIFRSQFDAYVRGDLDAFLKHWAENCTFRDMTEPAPRVGHEELRAYMSAYARDMTEIETRIDALFCTDSHALAEISITGTWRGDGAGPAGTRVTMNYCVVDVVRHGLVQKETVYWNPQQLADQLRAAAAAT
jgi:steroid delta-isomerase-like uncharacterized protein